MRRTLSFVLILALTGLGPVPLLACGQPFLKQAGCPMPMSQSGCDQMNMNETGTEVDAPQCPSSCVLAQPLPYESQYKAPDLSLSAPLETPGPTSDIVGKEYPLPAVTADFLSPSPLQPLLCVFLI